MAKSKRKRAPRTVLKLPDLSETALWEAPKSTPKMPTQVKFPRPNPLLLIALYSPGALLETGLRMCLPEKSQGSERLRCWAVRSLQSGLSRNNREIRACFAHFGGNESRFLRSSDCVAKREGFEPSVQVLARTTV